MNRRQLLTTAGVGTSALLVGCTDGGNGGGDDDPPDGEWELRARVVNEDDQPREWRVECRSSDGVSVAAAYSTLPAGEETELGLLGRLRDEQQEVYLESDGGTVSQPWQPTECRHLFVDVAISGGEPTVEEECREEA